jgi:hypothetical protein
MAFIPAREIPGPASRAIFASAPNVQREPVCADWQANMAVGRTDEELPVARQSIAIRRGAPYTRRTPRAAI